ncbi:MAG TPA: polyprenyl synthetase family protein [Hyphomonadaceae bacterium]
MTLHAEVRTAAALPASPLDNLVALLRVDLAEVEELLAERAASPVATIPDLSSYLISAGGKRLRPILTLASARAVGGRGSDAAIRLASAVEFIHTATLLHDDVVDDSDLRRGKAAAKNLWGASASILVGDFLFARAFTLMVETRDLRILDILSRASCVIAEGEVRQLAALGRADLAIPEYMAIVEAKTAALFEAAARAGALTGCNDEAIADSMGEYGRRLGRAFQLIDDLLDYGGLTSVIGKSVGDDFREGKLTLPVIYAREAADARDRKFWDRVMGERDQHEGDLAHAIHLIRSSGAAERTLEAARVESAAAQSALARAARGAYHDELASLADYCVNRAY